MQSVRIIKQ